MKQAFIALMFLASSSRLNASINAVKIPEDKLTV